MPIEIIPAIDLMDGKCVRLTQGDYVKKTVYHEDPLVMAKSFEDAGIRRLHLVDLDGANAHHIVNHRVLERIASGTSLTIDFGGGLKSESDLQTAFSCGASMVTGGSIAVKNPEVFAGWIEKFGAEKIILGADVKNGMIAVNGWLESTEEDLMTFIDTYCAKGIRKVICTDIVKDGMMQGPSIDLYAQILSRFPDLYLIASGGVSCMRDIILLAEAGVPAVITGKAIYEGTLSLQEISNMNLE
ncbi:MAG: 1-(5-phosphoribosyl)-5-[(5-phosphoribosylamino)methylideneamino]imidazole-4-carboxamide isomerase [Bacteroidales bacterium]|nr:1-(5-phosphoribosyl)-5-[(5-phosphoribosylamino)methylideneamino]imidazole-4-carboxamide isomerase [Bacteroidales bacterium]